MAHAILLAVQNGDQAEIERLVSVEPTCVLEMDEHGATHSKNKGAAPLFVACRKGDAPTVSILLACAHTDVNCTRVEGGLSPLIIAAQNGYEDVVKILLTSPAIDVNCAGDGGITALYMACFKGNVSVVRELLACSTLNVNHAIDRVSATALLRAAEFEHDCIVELLIAFPDIDVNVANSKGHTPLYAASRRGCSKVVALLLTVPSLNVNAPCHQRGNTALIAASEKGQTRIVKQLLAAPGVDVNHANSKQWTALTIASQIGHEEVVQLLLSCDGIDVNHAVSSGSTSLILASANGHLAVVKALLAVSGIDINRTNNRDDTALICANLNDHTEVAELLERACNLNAAQAKNLQLRLHWAAKKGHELVAQRLLDSGADVYGADAMTGATALLSAAKAIQRGTFPLLIYRGGPKLVNATDNEGLSPLLAVARMDQVICDLSFYVH